MLSGRCNLTTGHDLVSILRAVRMAQAVSDRSAHHMRRLLVQQQHVRIGLEVAAGVPLGSKSGDAADVEHDTAHVGDIGGAVFVLAVWIVGFAPKEGRAAIRGVTAALLGDVQQS